MEDYEARVGLQLEALVRWELRELVAEPEYQDGLGWVFARQFQELRGRIDARLEFALLLVDEIYQVGGCATALEGSAVARLPRSVSEIAELDGLRPSDLLRRVHERGRELGLETLAYLVRKGHGSGDHDLVREAAEHILRDLTLKLIAQKAARKWKFDWEDVYQGALAVMWKDFITKQGVPLIYWEERFYGAFKKKCLTIVKRMNRRRAREDKLQQELVQEVGQGDLVDVEDTVRTLDPRAIVPVLRGLSPKQQQAVVLAWCEGRPISGEEGSVSQTMGISPSMVHRHLRLAVAKIAELREADPELRRLLRLEE